MKLFEFLYYCIYIIALSIKDIDVNKRESLAADLYYIPLFFNTYMILFLILDIVSTRVPISYFGAAIISLTIFFGWIWICKKYFIINNNCERIIKYFQFKIKNRTALIIGILYYVLSFTFFVLSAKY